MRTTANFSAGRSHRPARLSFLRTGLAAVAALALVPAAASAQITPASVQAALKDGKASQDIRAFYESRSYRPLWIRGSTLSPEADEFLRLVDTATYDGLNPRSYRTKALATALKKGRDGSPKALASVEMLLSQAFAAYVRDVSRPRDVGMIYVDRQLAPTTPSARAILTAAASAPSMELYLRNIGWMHPVYGELRSTFAAAHRAGRLNGAQDQLLRLNMDRARALPPRVAGRHILVDAAAAKLYLYENGQVRDTMKVVVGKPDLQTPMMAGLIRYAMVNPYWNIPPDLVRDRIAPNVVSQGLGYLKAKRYDVLSDWSDDATIVSAAKIDWKAVAAGTVEVPVRQRPGNDNAMGKMKFMFPNEQGVYLHDTPDKELFAEADRGRSAGCVRVEDAQRLARWLFGKPIAAKGKKPEQRVDMPEPVPVYITYLTAAPDGPGVAFRKDVYNRDPGQLARLRTAALELR
ncbi:MAG TPA: L,D-transpeptidase family protein [Allosphingosinicella sp.]|nr:L,D-transpeptidase family protein [Allosphingosinicella sp.]